MTMIQWKAFWGMGTPRLEYSPLPSRVDPPAPIQVSGNVTLLHRRPDEVKAVPAIKIGDAVKTGQKLSLYGNGDYVTAPVTGSVSALNPFPGSFGRSYTAVAIAPTADEVFDEAFQAVCATPSIDALGFLNAAPGPPT